MFSNPHAAPYVFPEGKDPALSAYLNAHTEYDPATGCLLWTGQIGRTGTGRATKTVGQKHGTQQATRLAWMAGHGRKPEKGTQMAHRCGNPKCVHPHHLKEATPNDLWHDPDLGPPRRQGSVGALKLGKRIIPAHEVYLIQSQRPPREPHLGLRWVFRFQITPLGSHGLPLSHAAQERLEVIRAIRRCPIRASFTVLPCGFRRYDLPPGITEVPFTEPPPLTYEDVFGLVDDDEDPEAAPEADWVPTAKAA